MLIKVDTTPAAFFYKPFRLTEKARKDQINNTSAPQWNVSDNSDTSLTNMKNTINGADTRDRQKTIYKTFVRAEFLSVPETLLHVEDRP